MIRGCLAAVLFFGAPQIACAAPVLMISVDGMKPGYVLQADAHGLKIPYLRSLVGRGSYAEGVTGVWPTVTYPSHTTLVTGVAPSVHGIYNNVQFDPLHDRQEPWYWYASQIRSPTLWQAAHAAHYITASIGWPVTVGADIDYLIPEFWRTAGITDDPEPTDRYLIAELARPIGLFGQLQASAGPYMMANEDSLAGDAIKTRYSLQILRRHHPEFMAVHLSSLDEAQHAHGPFSIAANTNLEALDQMIAQLAEAALAANPQAIIVIVSDHGFAAVTQRVNVAIPFIQAGLIELAGDAGAPSSKIKSWKAQPWLAGGMAAIMLHDPHDRDIAGQVEHLLRKLAADPANGIAAIRTAPEMRGAGGFPDAYFVVEFAPGFYAGSNLTGPLVTPMPPGRGGHGYSPQIPDMQAAFFISGTGIANGRNLGVIDMRQIAPTLALQMRVSLGSAAGTALNVKTTR